METQKMIILRKFALLFFWCLCYSFSFKGFAQDNKKGADKSFFLTTKPQSFFFGANIGAEVPLSSKISIGGDITTHCWLVPVNISITPSMKYYLKGTIDKGFYAKFKVLGGVFFSETPIENKPYYTGAGIGIGGILPLFNSNKFYIFADAGLQFAVPFGHRSQSHVKDGSWGMTYYTLLSPASIPDLSIGVALKF